MDIKEQILAAGLARFNSQGVSQTTVRHITTELGIGLGHFSYYFRKKDDLINALYLRWIDELEAHVTPFTSGTVEVQFAHLLGSVREATRIVYRYKFLMLDWASIMRTVAPVRQHYRQHIARRRHELGALFTQLVADGYYRPPAHPQQLLMLVDATFILENFWVVYAEILSEDRTEAQQIDHSTQLYFTLVGMGLTEKGTAALQAAFAQLAAPAPPAALPAR